MKKIYLFIFSLFSIFVLTGCKNTSQPNLNTEDLHNYTLSICLETDSKSASVKQNLSYINNTEKPLSEIKFHLYPQFFQQECITYVIPNTKMNDAFPNGMSYSTFNIEEVKVENASAEICFEGDFDEILNIPLSNTLQPNKRINISIDFNFTLPNCEHRFGYGQNTLNLANFYPIACVYENENFNTSPYNSNGDPFYSDISNYDVTISAPCNYIIAASGEKVSSSTKGNLQTTNFLAKGIRDFALVASNKFEMINSQIEDTTVEYYYFNDQNAESNLKTCTDAIKTFNNLFGKYPYKTLSVVKTDFIHGGMEYPNLVMISGDIETDDDYKNVIIHEIAHQWWYGVVGNDEFKYPWLDEALTEFSTILFYDYNEGYNLTHKDMININKDNFTTFVDVYEEVLGTIDTSMRSVDQYSTEPEYTYCTYVKGVLMYESLYQLIGEKTFIDSLKFFYQNNAYTNAEPEDLISAFEQTSGKELDNFFKSWISGKVIIR